MNNSAGRIVWRRDALGQRRECHLSGPPEWIEAAIERLLASYPPAGYDTRIERIPGGAIVRIFGCD